MLSNNTIRRNNMKYYALSNESIKDFDDKMQTFLHPIKLSNQNKSWMSLTFEEILLSYKEALPEGTLFSYKYKKLFGSVLIEIFVKGNMIDLLHKHIDDEDSDSFSILDNLFAACNGQTLYRYSGGDNIISVSIPVVSAAQKFFKNKTFFAILLSVFVGLLLRFLPAQTQTVLYDSYISPVYSKLMAILKGVTEPAIFVSLVVGICGLGDLETMNKVGKKILFTFLITSSFMFVFAVAVCWTVFGGQGGGTSFKFSDLLPFLLDSLPQNFLAPFTNGNMIQIVIVGIVTGICLLTLGEKASMIKQALVEFKFYFFSVLNGFSRVLPAIVFLSVLKAFLSLKMSEAAEIWKLIATDLSLHLVFLLGFLILVSMKCKVGISLLIHKALPIMSTSFTTGSTTAALPLFYQHFKERFGIDEKYANIHIPLSATFFSPSLIFALIVYTFFAAHMQGVGPSVMWLIVLYIMIIQMGMATPKIPGGIIASITLIFSQLSLNMDQLGIIMAANIIILYFDTAAGSTIHILCTILDARKERAIDMDVLRSRNY